MSQPTTAFQDLAKYAMASGEIAPIQEAQVYLKNLYSDISKEVQEYKSWIVGSIIIATISGIIIYRHLKNKKE